MAPASGAVQTGARAGRTEKEHDSEGEAGEHGEGGTEDHDEVGEGERYHEEHGDRGREEPDRGHRSLIPGSLRGGGCQVHPEGHRAPGTVEVRFPVEQPSRLVVALDGVEHVPGVPSEVHNLHGVRRGVRAGAGDGVKGHGVFPMRVR